MRFKPKVLVLRNPRNAQKGAKPVIEEWFHPDQQMNLRNPVLFVHGVEYANTSEILADFILPFARPFEKGASLSGNLERDYVFLAWDSRLFCDETRRTMLLSPLKKISTFIRKAPNWPIYLEDAERRARLAAEFLAPFYHRLFPDSLEESMPKHHPLVISHSLGSYLWATTLKGLLLKNPQIRFGTWWNMQGAVLRSSFSPGGEFAMVADAFASKNGSRHYVWYSRFDFVLATLYSVAKKSLAVGQVGGTHPSMSLIDVSHKSLEAHGRSRILSDQRCFFSRISDVLQLESERLLVRL